MDINVSLSSGEFDVVSFAVLDLYCKAVHSSKYFALQARKHDSVFFERHYLESLHNLSKARELCSKFGIKIDSRNYYRG